MKNLKYKILSFFDRYYPFKEYYSMRTHGKKLNLKEPKSLTEKLFWLHIYWQNPLVVQCADKVLVKEYINNLGLGKYNVPLIASYNNVEQINFDEIEYPCVIKCNHGCGFNIICETKEQSKIESIKQKLDKWMHTIYGLESLEMHYSKIKPLILFEKYIDFGDVKNIVDIKLHCINGEPFCFLICHHRDTIKNTVQLSSYSLSWQKLDFLKNESSLDIEKPEKLDELLEIARIIAKPFPYLRLDFYIANNNIYVGEMTFTPAGNVMDYYKDSTLDLMGNKLKLPNKLNNRLWI